MTRRIFIGFFGLTRALTRTIDSIERNIFAPFAQNNLRVVRAAHFNNPAYIEAPRSGEHRVPFHLGDLTRLRLDHVDIEPQDDANIAEQLAAVATVPYAGETDVGGFTRRNALHQLYSLRRLSHIFQALEPSSFDAALLVRPDLQYLDPMPVRQLLDQVHLRHRASQSLVAHAGRWVRRHGRPEADIVTPWWQHAGGLNDRFAFATPDAAMVYMTRLGNVAEYCTLHGFYHAEQLLGYSIAKAGLRGAGTWVRAQRIRSDGTIAARDVPNLKKRLYYATVYPLHRQFRI